MEWIHSVSLIPRCKIGTRTIMKTEYISGAVSLVHIPIISKNDFYDDSEKAPSVSMASPIFSFCHFRPFFLPSFPASFLSGSDLFVTGFIYFNVRHSTGLRFDMSPILTVRIMQSLDTFNSRITHDRYFTSLISEQYDNVTKNYVHFSPLSALTSIPALPHSSSCFKMSGFSRGIVSIINSDIVAPPSCLQLFPASISSLPGNHYTSDLCASAPDAVPFSSLFKSTGRNPAIVRLSSKCHSQALIDRSVRTTCTNYAHRKMHLSIVFFLFEST